MGHEISIIRPDREPLVLTVDDSSYRRREIMGEDELVLNFSLAVYEEIPAGSTVTFEGDTYTLFQSCRVDKRGSRNFEYQATFNADYAFLRKYMFYNWVDKRLSFDLTARPWEHIQMIVDNLNDRLQPGDTPWVLGEGCIESAEKLISYSCNNCMEALQAVADTFETEWEVKGRTIFLRKVEYNADSPLELSYGRGKGLRAGIQRTAYNDETPAARVYIQGGERNIFLSEYGSRELKFPKSSEIGYDGEKFEGEDGYDSTKAVRYVTDGMGQSVTREGGPVNGGDDVALDLTHIYPSHTCEVESVEYLYKSGTYGSVDELVAAYPELADENAEGWDNVQVDVVVKEDAYLPDYSANELQVPGETRQVVFQSGNLASREFDINDYDHEERRFKLVSEWVDGFRMPAGPVYHPSTGNKFIVVGVSLPSEYVSEAEDKALREAVKYLYEHEAQKVTINAEIDPIQAARMWDSWGPKIILGGFVRLTDDDLLAEVSDIRIKAVKQYVNTPTKPVVELSNSTASVSFGTTIRELENQEVHTDELHKDSIQFSKRRWREAKETISMLQGALDNFTEGISPITVETMSMLVGDERLQFVFTKSLTSNESGDLVYAYDSETGVFSVQSAYIKHMTLGIDSISPVHSDEEYKRWQVSEVSQTLERESAYYLYAVVSKNSSSGSFELHKDVQKDTEESYYLLVGILNSEYDGLRTFAPMYGYTEVRPGQIVTENIQSADGKTWLDLLRGILHLNDNAGVSGAIDVEKGDKSIAAWFGGLMEDLEFDDNPSNPANTLFRHDGSGYLAKGNIKFNEKGEVELSPNIKISGTGNETLDSILTMLAVLNDMFYFADDETIGTKYNFFSEKQVAAGGAGDPETGGGAGGMIVDSEMSETSDNAVSNRVIKEYVDKTDAVLSERIAALELGGGGGGSGGGVVGEGDKYYYHTQAATAEEWVIEHNLGKFPAVTVVSSAGEEIYCDKRFVSINKVVLNFGTPVSGAAFLN